eukprot:359083-Chlamydomonas_euryale.AAC.7
MPSSRADAPQVAALRHWQATSRKWSPPSGEAGSYPLTYVSWRAQAARFCDCASACGLYVPGLRNTLLSARLIPLQRPQPTAGSPAQLSLAGLDCAQQSVTLPGGVTMSGLRPAECDIAWGVTMSGLRPLKCDAAWGVTMSGLRPLECDVAWGVTMSGLRPLKCDVAWGVTMSGPDWSMPD